MHDFVVRFYGLLTCKSYPVPAHINSELVSATSPHEINRIISEYEVELARLHNPNNDFLVCDTATELMADVLRLKGIGYKIICGVNDEGDARSHVEVDGIHYDSSTRLGVGLLSIGGGWQFMQLSAHSIKQDWQQFSKLNAIASETVSL